MIFFPSKKRQNLISFLRMPVLPREREVLLSQCAHTSLYLSLSLSLSLYLSLSLSLSISLSHSLCICSVQRTARRAALSLKHRQWRTKPFGAPGVFPVGRCTMWVVLLHNIYKIDCSKCKYPSIGPGEWPRPRGPLHSNILINIVSAAV